MKIALYNMAFALLGGGERRTAALAAHLAKNHDVTLFVREPIAPGTIERAFGIGMIGVTIVPLGEGNHLPAVTACNADLFINNWHGSTLANPAPRGIFMCMFPEHPMPALDTYAIVTANSRFTAGWIEKRWGCRADVVYSACADFGPPEPKENLILHVGRYFADTPTTHHKRQDMLLRTFKRMVDAGLAGWRLRFVGHRGDGARDARFLDVLKRDAEAYPVEVLVDTDYGVLRESYRKAALYWHGTGYGTSAEEQPSKQEHFGMTIVEAMSAGAVPIAFNSGGPRETIEPGASGYLWNDAGELAAMTQRLIDDPAQRGRLSDAAVAASRRFSVEAFLARMDALIARLE